MNPITVRPEVTAPTSTDIIDPVAAAVDTISETLPVEGLTDSVSTTDVPSADTLTSAASIPTEAPILDTNASEDLIVSMDSDDGKENVYFSTIVTLLVLSAFVFAGRFV